MKSKISNLKNILTALVFSIILISGLTTTSAFGEEQIKVKINGSNISFEQPPVQINGRTLVPLRKIFEELDVLVKWDGDTKKIFGYKDNTVITLQVGSNVATIQTDENTTKTVNLDVAPQVINSTTVVPVRFIGESLGADVKWDGSTKTVIINMEKTTTRIEFDGAYYEGETKNGTMHGYGKMVWDNEGTYEGQWVNGEMTVGTMTKPNGETYPVNSTGENTSNNQGTNEDTPDNFEEEEIYTIGDIVDAGNIQYQVTKAFLAQRLENDYAEPEGQFLVLEVKMLNKTQSSIDISSFEWERFNLQEFDGTQYELQAGAMEVIPDNQNLVNQFGFLVSLSPKIERTMYFVYDIPKNVTTAYTVNLPGTTNTQVDTIMGKIDRAIQNDKEVTITIN